MDAKPGGDRRSRLGAKVRETPTEYASRKTRCTSRNPGFTGSFTWNQWLVSVGWSELVAYRTRGCNNIWCQILRGQRNRYRLAEHLQQDSLAILAAHALVQPDMAGERPGNHAHPLTGRQPGFLGES